MVVAKDAKNLVGLAHTNMLTALSSADPNDVNLCYGLINNLFQLLKLEDFYTELDEVQNSVYPVGSVGKDPVPDNVIPFPTQAVVEQAGRADEVAGQISLFQEPEPETDSTSTRTRGEVRDLLTKVAKAGKNIKGLLQRYGAEKLSDLNESTYDAIYKDAEALMLEV